MWLLYCIAVTLTLAREFTVSGISSGAFMSTQMHFAYSKDIKSSSVIAGGPYYCALGSILNTANCMLYPQFILQPAIYDYIDRQEKAGSIDPTSNLKSSTVFLYSGLLDTVVIQPSVRINHSIYSYYVDSGNINTLFNVASQHAWITESYGNLCAFLSSPYMNDCDIDIAEKILTVAYGSLKPKAKQVAANLRSFDQKPYISSSYSSMADTGYIYVPSNCKDTISCRIHVAFHGCKMGYATIGDAFIKNSGLNEWAEGNNIIILYPQANSSLIIPYNPEGCWDWWGYSGSDYTLKSGVQMKAVYDMVQNLPNMDKTQYI
jgi:poly(3-hydroxybutyrate) depolymerase